MKNEDIEIGGEYYILRNNSFHKVKIIARNIWQSIYHSPQVNFFADGCYAGCSPPTTYDINTYGMIENDYVLCKVDQIATYLEEFSK